ncbi:DUF4232 domain-containing protein [Streptosporangium amethystogenes subsp. fukuiense]|uniref:DUF4232 domain-containing protein n=1 Tax=Streptosporangium amethystogenes subsp. fukuiense TaxID=698418 RepID=A0ABW2SUQ4_9ACTN
MKRSIGAGLLAAASALAVLAATTACAPPVTRDRGAAPASGGAPASLSPATASSSPGSAPARPAVAVQAAGLRVADSGTAAGRCRTEALAARVGRVDAGAGQRYAPLVFTNTSARACWVYGFVGLIMIDGSGDAMRTRTRRESVQPRRITLRPGASAHARLHWSEVPGGSRSCPASARLMIIPPDEVAHLEIPFKATVCDDGRLDVTPMASGARL